METAVLDGVGATLAARSSRAVTPQATTASLSFCGRQAQPSMRHPARLRWVLRPLGYGRQCEWDGGAVTVRLLNVAVQLASETSAAASVPWVASPLSSSSHSGVGSIDCASDAVPVNVWLAAS